MKKTRKKQKEQGVTLIALVVTIVVLLILAATSIAMLTGDNGIITNAQKAQIANKEGEVIDKMGLAYSAVKTEAMLKMSIEPGYQPIVNIEALANVAAKELGLVNAEKAEVPEKITDGYKVYYQDGSSVITILYGDDKFSLKVGGKAENNLYPNLKGVISLSTTEVIYSKLPTRSDRNMPVNEISSSDIANATDKSEYYGVIVKEYECTNSAGVNEWKIFYADENNIYLIADDYIHYDYCPSSSTQAIYKNSSDYKLSMNNVINDYTGSINITDTKIQNLNKSYFEYLTQNSKISKNDNMKAVGYMLDTEVWKVYAGEKAEYAIGGPTVEMLMKSYNQKYGVDYKARAKNEVGYEISKDGGINWATYYSGMLNTNDNLYMIKDTDKAGAMWLATPSANRNDRVMIANYDGYINMDNFNNTYIGFRPLVCLKSDVKLQKNVDGTYSIK